MGGGSFYNSLGSQLHGRDPNNTCNVTVPTQSTTLITKRGARFGAGNRLGVKKQGEETRGRKSNGSRKEQCGLRSGGSTNPTGGQEEKSPRCRLMSSKESSTSIGSFPGLSFGYPLPTDAT